MLVEDLWYMFVRQHFLTVLVSIPFNYLACNKVLHDVRQSDAFTAYLMRIAYKVNKSFIYFSRTLFGIPHTDMYSTPKSGTGSKLKT